MSGVPPELRAAFTAALAERIAALDAAGRALADGPRGAADSVRRLAHALRRAAGTSGFPEIADAAAAVEDAPPEALAPRLDALLGVLNRTAASGRGPERVILVVEDDRAIARLIEVVIGAPDRRILTAQTVLGAQLVLDDHDVALILLDLVLPDADGRNLVVRLREEPRTATVPIVVLSALGSAQVRSECFALGADEYIVKPFEPPALAATVARLLARPRCPPGPRTPAPPAPTATAPTSAASVAPRPAPAPPPRSAGLQVAAPPGPILVAEDDDLIAALIGHRLARDGLEVRRFTDGASALEAAGAMRAALAILDVKMPAMDGFELLERLRAMPTWADTPVLMLTSMGNERDIARGLALGANDYMVKPFSPVELLARVNRLLRR